MTVRRRQLVGQPDARRQRVPLGWDNLVLEALVALEHQALGRVGIDRDWRPGIQLIRFL